MTTRKKVANKVTGGGPWTQVRYGTLRPGPPPTRMTRLMGEISGLLSVYCRLDDRAARTDNDRRHNEAVHALAGVLAAFSINRSEVWWDQPEAAKVGMVQTLQRTLLEAVQSAMARAPRADA